MPTPEELQAKLDAKLGGGTAANPGGTRMNVASDEKKQGRLSRFLDFTGLASTVVNPLTQSVAIHNMVDRMLGKQGADELSAREQIKANYRAAFSGREYLKAFGYDLDKADLPLVSGGAEDITKTAIDAIVNPASVASMVATPLRVPAALAKTPLGRLAFRLGGETALGVGGAEVAERTFDQIPENAPNWVKMVAPVGAAVLTTGAATGVANRALNVGTRQGMQTAAEQLASSARSNGGKYLAPLPDIKDILDAAPEPSATRVGRVLAPQYDPIKAETTTTGRYIRAYERLARVAPVAAKFSVVKALPTGFSAFKIGDDGSILNLFDARGNRLGEGVHWNDVLSDPEAAVKYNFTHRQMDQWEAALDLLDEIPQFAAQYGLDWTVRDVDGRFYFPRQVKGANTGLYEKPSDPRLMRLHESATEAALKGVTYADPQSTLAFHVEQVYRAIAKQEFSDAVEQFTVLPSSAFAKTAQGGRLIANHRNALKAFNKAKTNLAAAQRRAQRIDARLWEASRSSGNELRRQTLFNDLDLARKAVEKAKDGLKTARMAKDDARTLRNAAFESYKKSGFTKVPSHMFGRAGDEMIPVGLWKNRFYPADGANRLTEWADPITGAVKDASPHPFVRAVGQLGGLQRTMVATMDLGVLFLQMAPLLATNPVAWGRAAVKSIEAMLLPGTINRYMQQNAESMQDMITKGRVPPGDVEFFTSLQGPSLAQRAAGYVLSPFERQYNAALLATRHEYWKALRGTSGMTDEQLGSFIRNVTGGMDTAALGINHSQRALESLAFFAPALMRSTGALMLKAAKPWTPEGAEAAHAVLKTLGATAAIFTLANIAEANAKGETQAQLDERLRTVLNPLEGKKFLSVRIGDNYYGLGGTVRAMSQFVINAIAGGINWLEDGTIEGAEDNPLTPLLRFMGDRNSPAYKDALGIAEYITGEELNLLEYNHITSIPDLLQFIGSSSLPFLAQEALEAGLDPMRELDPDPLSAAATGLRVSPISPSERRDDIARELFGMEYIKLTPQEKRDIADRYPSLNDSIRAFADKEERHYNEQVDIANETTTVSLQAVARNLAAGVYADRAKMREDIEDIMTARATKLVTLRHAFGKDFSDLEDTQTSSVLDAYYDTFKGARINPDDETSPINFEILEQLQATFMRQIENGLYGDKNRAKEVLDERTAFRPPPELAQFFANKELVQKSGYWDAKDRAFRMLKQEITSERMFASVRSAGELSAKLMQLESAGDLDGAAIARGYLRAIDRIAGAEHRIMRVENPGLDRALKENGYTTTRLTLDEDESEEE